MTDAPADPFTLTPAEAGAALAAMDAGANPSPPAVQDAQDARARLDLLSRDATWANRLFNGDVAARKEFDDLVAASAAGDNVDDAIAGIEEPAPIFETTTGGQLPRRVVNEVIASMRDAGVSDGAIGQALRGDSFSREEVAAVTALRAKLHGDADWVKRLLSGDYAAKREHLLMSIVLSSPVSD